MTDSGKQVEIRPATRFVVLLCCLLGFVAEAGLLVIFIFIEKDDSFQPCVSAAMYIAAGAATIFLGATAMVALRRMRKARLLCIASAAVYVLAAIIGAGDESFAWQVFLVFGGFVVFIRLLISARGITVLEFLCGAFESTFICQKDRPARPSGSPMAHVLLVFSAVFCLLGLLSFLGGFVFRLALMVTRLDFVVDYGPWASIVLSAGAVVLARLSLVRYSRYAAAIPRVETRILSGFSLLLLLGSSLLTYSYDLRQRLASCLCDSTFRATFEAHRAEGGPEVTPRIMKEVRGILLRRLDRRAYGLVKIKIMEGNRVQIDQNLYGTRDAAALLSLVTKRGILEFGILPRHGEGDLTEEDIFAYRAQLASSKLTETGDSTYLWKKVQSPENFDVAEAVTGQSGDDAYVLTSRRDGETLLHSYDKDMWRVLRAEVTTDRQGRKAISFVLDDAGAFQFLSLTRENLERPLAILIDDEVVTAPRINGPISRSVLISGQFSWEEVDYLVTVLGVPPLPVELHAVYE